METVLFFKFPAATAQEYTDVEKYFSQSGNSTEFTQTYRSCLAKGELLVCKINHDQVSAEQKLGLTKVRPYLFLMLIYPIAPILTVPNRTVIPLTACPTVPGRGNSYTPEGTFLPRKEGSFRRRKIFVWKEAFK